MKFKEHEFHVKSISPQYEKEKEFERLALINIIDDWSEERTKLIEANELYKECFELFIPDNKKDEATLFLSVGKCGLAKDIAIKEGCKI